MNLRYMLDTNICIYVMKNRPKFLADLFDMHARELCISSVTAMELYYGVECSAQRSNNSDKLESFLARLEVLDYNLVAAYQTGIIRAELRRSGAPIGAYDGMIAGHARANSLTVVTNNMGEFSRVSGLMVENWLQQFPQSTVNELTPAYR